MVVASLVHYDNTHKFVEDLYRKAQREGEEDWLVFDLQVIKTALETMKSDYLYLLSDKDNILRVAEIYADQSNREKNEIEELNRELKYTLEAVNDAQISLQEVENQIRITNHS